MESDKEEVPQQIGLELPDYSQAYLKWKEKIEKENKEEENIVIIDIY